MQWSYPARDDDPWYEKFEQLTIAQDSSGYANREDRHTTFSGGGAVSFNATTGVVTWDAAIELLSPIAGFKMTVAASNFVLADGEVAYVNLVRSPTQNVAASPAVASTAPNTDDAFTLCVRNGDSIYWANGSRIADGESKSLFYGIVPGTTLVEIVNIASRASHDDVTPLVVGAMAFNPTDYDKPGYSRVISFRALAANGDIGITTYVKLLNVTDGYDEVASLSFTTTDITKDEVVLVEGSGVGEIDLAEKIYEVQISLAAPPGSATETVELYDAEIQVVSTAI
jgi:hypothetical protein